MMTMGLRLGMMMDQDGSGGIITFFYTQFAARLFHIPIHLLPSTAASLSYSWLKSRREEEKEEKEERTAIALVFFVFLLNNLR